MNDISTYIHERLANLINGNRVRLFWREEIDFGENIIESIPKYRYYKPNRNSIRAMARMIAKLHENPNIKRLTVSVARPATYHWRSIVRGKTYDSDDWYIISNLLEKDQEM